MIFITTQYKNIIVFGRSRAGKSTLAYKISQKFPYQILRADPLRDSFAACFPHENIKVNTALENHYYQQFIYDYLCRMTYEARGLYGYVMEGFEINIDTITKYCLNEEHLIYCLGTLNISPEKFAENIYKNNTPYDWTYNMTRKELLEFAKGELEASERLIEICNKYHIPFFNTALNREDIFNDILSDIQKKYIKK